MAREFCLKCGEPMRDDKCLYCPKTYNDGLEAAAFNIEQEAKMYSVQGSTLAYATKDVQAILVGASRRIRELRK